MMILPSIARPRVAPASSRLEVQTVSPSQRDVWRTVVEGSSIEDFPAGDPHWSLFHPLGSARFYTSLVIIGNGTDDAWRTDFPAYSQICP